jgi:hypothetical protein
MSSNSGSRRQTKVERLIEEQDLKGLEATLTSRWTAEGDNRMSLRELADIFNERLLESALLEAGENPIEGEVRNYYQVLTDDDASVGARTEVRNKLERAGVEIDALESDFVSHQAIHTYLTSRKGVSYEAPDDEGRLKRAEESLRRLEGRTETVTENTISRLKDDSTLSLGEFLVMTSVDILCEECGTRHDVTSLLEQGGCDCQQE